VRVLVTGAGGQLGADLVAAFSEAGSYQVVGAPRSQLDVGDRDAVRAAMGAAPPDVIVHAGAWTAVDACESDPDRAWRVNAVGTRNVAEGAARVGAYLLYVSTDYVFDGTSSRPYVEWDDPRPLGVYGRSKLGGEREALAGAPGACVVRTSWVCGPHGTNILKTILGLAATRDRLAFVDDQRGCPTFTGDLARMIVRLAAERRPGIYHVTNQGETTWFQFARDVVAAAGRDPAMVEPVATSALHPPRPAPRPANSVLDNAALRAAGVPLLRDHHQPLEETVRSLL
jgi:dTDP-4-dehydrorhamnose reductase